MRNTLGNIFPFTMGVGTGNERESQEEEEDEEEQVTERVTLKRRHGEVKNSARAVSGDS